MGGGGFVGGFDEVGGEEVVLAGGFEGGSGGEGVEEVALGGEGGVAFVTGGGGREGETGEVAGAGVEGAVAQHVEGLPGAVEAEAGHGGVVLEDLTAAGTVDPAAETAGPGEADLGGIFAGDAGVDAAGVGAEGLGAPEQVAGGVQKMDEGFVDEETGVLGEVGLVGVGRVEETVVVGVGPDDVFDGAEFAGLQQALDFAVPGLPAPVLVDHEADAGGVGGGDDLLGFGQGGGEGFLAEDVSVVLGGEASKGEMGVGTGDEVDEVGLFGGEHGGGVGVVAGEVEVAREGFGAGGVLVAAGGDLAVFGEAVPVRHLDAGEEAAADDDPTVHGVSLSWCLMANGVDEYLMAQTPAARKVLRQVRAAIRKALPGAEETISYKIPTYKVKGKAVIYFAGWKGHYAVYPVSEELVRSFGGGEFEVEKGTVRFGWEAPVPVELIGFLARSRAGLG